jgi:hypothetical protein
MSNSMSNSMSNPMSNSMSNPMSNSMSNSARTSAASSAEPMSAPGPVPLPISPFLERLVRLLLPYFIGMCPDLESARSEILETLASYGSRTRSGLLNAAQVIAYGLAGLETLHEAKTTEMSPSMRLRYRGCANNLNRSCQKTEQILAIRLAGEDTDAARSPAETAADLPETRVQEAIQDVQATIDANRNRLSGARASIPGPRRIPPSQQENKRLWGGAMMNALAQMGMPVQPVPSP